MRLSGSILIIAGALLCVSVVWAAIGFVAMALGLICLQIPIKQVSLPRNAIGTDVVPPHPVEQIAGSAGQSSAPASAAGSGAWKEEFDWDTLVARDEDLANVERLLSRYGAIYVDQLRALYGIFNNKVLLPSIVSLIVESAKHQAGQTASAAVGTSNWEVREPGTSVARRDERPIDALDSSVALVEPESSTADPSSGEEGSLSHSDGLHNVGSTSLEGTGEASATADVEDIVNLTVIFDQMSHSKN